MTIETVRRICRALPSVSEDVKWGSDLCFLVGGRMFAVLNLDPPHSLSFKCTPETFGELVERPGLRPAPYLARNMWVQEEELGSSLERPELERLIRTSYDLVVDRIPKSRRPGAAPGADRTSRSSAAGRRGASDRAARRRR